MLHMKRCVAMSSICFIYILKSEIHSSKLCYFWGAVVELLLLHILIAHLTDLHSDPPLLLRSLCNAYVAFATYSMYIISTYVHLDRSIKFVCSTFLCLFCPTHIPPASIWYHTVVYLVRTGLVRMITLARIGRRAWRAYKQRAFAQMNRHLSSHLFPTNQYLRSICMTVSFSAVPFSPSRLLANT